MRCDHCTEPAMAFAPGNEPTRELFVLQRGEPMRCWCTCHWAAQFGMSLTLLPKDGANAGA